MKPPPFRYARPESLDEVLDLLAEHNGEARVLAGGQSLIPLLNFRLARPEVLIDLASVEELRSLAAADGMLRIGATTTQREVERSDMVAGACPLITRALPHVGHLQNRIRGTVVGSIAHADPAAELPAVALASDARMVVLSSTGRRTIPAAQFFLGPFTTALEPDEILTEVHFPMSGDLSAAVMEVAPRAGDFALAGVAGTLRNTPGRVVDRVALALFGVGPAPQRLHDVEAALIGTRITAERLDEVAALTIRTARAGAEDVHAGAAYRRQVAGELARRAVAEMVS